MALYLTDASGNVFVAGTSITGIVAPSSGSGDKAYTHTQSSAATVWHVAHNLGKYPSITVVDSAGTQVYGSVVFNDLNNVTLTFSSGFAGYAYCN